MNKLDLIETLKSKAGLSKKESAAVVGLFFDEMAEALASGDIVEIRGLCSFSGRRNYKERLPYSESLRIMREHLSKKRYSLRVNNCDHFATYFAI